MLQRLCLMASHGYPPGLVLQQELGLPNKGCQTILPSTVFKPDMLRYQSPCLKPNPCEDSMKPQSEWFDSNQLVNFDSSARKPMLSDVQASCSNALLFGFGIVEQCTKHDKIVKFLKSATAEQRIEGANISSLLDLMKLQLAGIDEPQQPLSSLIYPNDKFDIQQPLLYVLQDSALTSKITVHLDGQITFMGTPIEMKDLLYVVAESYLSKNLHKGGKNPMLVPHFGRVNVNEVEVQNSSTLKIQSTLTAPPLKSPQRVKLKPSHKKNKKVIKERDLYKKNHSRACETLLSLMVDKKQRRKTAIPSLKKSGPELPELLTQFSACIAGTGLAFLLSVICNLACGKALFCASNLFNTGIGFGLVCVSWAVSKLRATIVTISKNSAKLGLKDEEMIQKLEKSMGDIYLSASALLAVVMLRLA